MHKDSVKDAVLRAYNSTRVKQWMAQKKAAGLCQSCGVNPSEGRARCQKCIDRRKKLAGPKHQQWKQATLQELRAQFIDQFGGRCACCGEQEFGFLTVDHINNDGHKERNQTQQARYLRAAIAGHRSDLQVLCFNCNCGRAANHNVCPHVQPKIKKLAAQENFVFPH